MSGSSSEDYSYTENREVSWLKFNLRVLEEARCTDTPAFERYKFLSIFTSNLDEFYMVRVGSLYDLAIADDHVVDNKSGLTCKEQLDVIFNKTVSLYEKRDTVYKQVTAALAEQGVMHLSYRELNASQKKYAEKYFTRSVLPVLSPQIIDRMHPFPHLNNKQLYIAARVERGKKEFFGLIPVPQFIDRIIVLPEQPLRFILLEDLIYEHASEIFKLFDVTEKAVISVTRNADINLEEGLFDADIDFRQQIKKILKTRSILAPVRLESSKALSENLQDYLCKQLNLRAKQHFVSKAPLEMSFVYPLENVLPRAAKSQLLFTPFQPQDAPDISLNRSMIRQIQKRDLLLSYPYESMKPFLTLISEAANDQNVISIKITLYRIGRTSNLVESLIKARENGKEVTVLMELRARFDEENNIEWAKLLEDAGCNVLYGMDGYKVHSKICLITRKERGKLQYISQIGTGNYNEKTVRLYTDLSLMTADQEIGRDAADLFVNLSTSNLNGYYRKLWIAPNGLKNNVIHKINLEIEKAKSGHPASIIMKLNSLTDRDILDKLSEASQSKVPIRLIVRGICCLIPGIPGKTDNISVTSIVGRFLEHSRIYCFGVKEEADIYIASADMMTRNTNRRVEAACPVQSPRLKRQIRAMLDILLSDTVKGRKLYPDGYYRYLTAMPGATSSQEKFIQMAVANSVSRVIGGNRVLAGIRRFLPNRH